MQIPGLGSSQVSGQAVPRSFHDSLIGQLACVAVFVCQTILEPLKLFKHINLLKFMIRVTLMYIPDPAVSPRRSIPRFPRNI